MALPRLVEIGGSHAQRDLFHQIWLDALQRSRQWAAVQNVLQPMVNGQPESLRLVRQVGGGEPSARVANPHTAVSLDSAKLIQGR